MLSHNENNVRERKSLHVMRGQVFNCSGVVEHKNLGQNGNSFQVDGEGPQELHSHAKIARDYVHSYLRHIYPERVTWQCKNHHAYELLGAT